MQPKVKQPTHANSDNFCKNGGAFKKALLLFLRPPPLPPFYGFDWEERGGQERSRLGNKKVNPPPMPPEIWMAPPV